MHLTDHLGRGGGGLESATCADQFGHEGGTCHDGRFFDGHRDQHVTPVDLEVESDAERQAVHADHVFDHVVGGLGGESTACKREQVFGSQMR